MSVLPQRTTVKDATCNPRWYETLVFDDVQLPSRKRIGGGLAPQILVQLWDHDALSGDEFLGRIAIDLTHLGHTMPVQPTWYDLRDDDENDNDGSPSGGSGLGRLLLSAQVLGPLPTELPPLPQIRGALCPPSRDCSIEFLLLGCRGLKPVGVIKGLRGLNSPYVQLSFSAAASTASAATSEPRQSNQSARPTASSPTYCELIKARLPLPEDAVFAPAVDLVVKDSRFVGSDAILGTASVSLEPFLPWLDSTYMQSQRERLQRQQQDRMQHQSLQLSSCPRPFLSWGSFHVR